MIFDLSFLNLELEAAVTETISAELLSHPAFRAIAEHEAELQRPVWDEESFRIRFAAAAAENKEKWSDWGLSPLFREREKLAEMKKWLETEQKTISDKIADWLANFTSVPQRENLCCVPYVGSYDAGFSPSVGSGIIYLNLPVLSCKESFLETLVHESYHARQVSTEAKQRCMQIEANQNPIVQLMYITAEEGTANLVGYHGAAETQYPVIPLRTPEEGTEQLKQLLSQYANSELSGQDVLNAFMQSDCCYTAGGYIAKSVWDKFAMDGLDLWSAKADLNAYYEAFRATMQGADWPELFLQ